METGSDIVMDDRILPAASVDDPETPPRAGAAIDRVLVVSDTFEPQVNGVVRTISALRGALAGDGCALEVIGPDRFRSLPMPSYPELRLGLVGPGRMAREMVALAPQSVHIATEGPLGWAARAACARLGWAFTSAFHTRFPDYIHARSRLPRGWTWGMLRRFHAPSRAVLAATEMLRDELESHGFARVLRWGRGVDLDRFRPEPREAFADLPRPVFLHVGRLAVEKNVEAFLSLDLPGSKVVIGDGPHRTVLERRFAEAHFLGAKAHADLPPFYAGADALVFPSRTDTFGLVVLEALACGTPVAAFPAPGPRDVIGSVPVGCIDPDLRTACLGALRLDRRACRVFAEGWSWQACARAFLGHMVPVTG